MITCVWSMDSMIVAPAGGAALSNCAAICPPAPDWFWTMKTWPSICLPSLSIRARATTSVAPPGGNPTSTRIGPAAAASGFSAGVANRGGGCWRCLQPPQLRLDQQHLDLVAAHQAQPAGIVHVAGALGVQADAA